jgi:hypothetical protein
MTGTGRLEGRSENGVNLVISVLPVETQPFIRITHVYHIRESLECPSGSEAGKSTKKAIKWEEFLKPDECFSDVLGSLSERCVMNDFECVLAVSFGETLK